MGIPGIPSLRRDCWMVLLSPTRYSRPGLGTPHCVYVALAISEESRVAAYFCAVLSYGNPDAAAVHVVPLASFPKRLLLCSGVLHHAHRPPRGHSCRLSITAQEIYGVQWKLSASYRSRAGTTPARLLVP